jgi:hypothetical protein
LWNMTREQIDITLFRIHILSQALLESLDDMRGTPFYRHKIKSTVNTLHDMLLGDINNTITSLFNEDEELMLHMSTAIDAITASLANDPIAVIASYPTMINEIKQQYERYEQGAADSAVGGEDKA